MNLTSISITRREIAIRLLAIAGSSALPYWASAQDDDTRLQITLPPADGSHSTFDVFLALSRIVLIQADLDQVVARQLYDLFMAEPWGPKHIGTAYAALRETFTKRGQRGGKEMVAQTPLPVGEQWFISHLVTTWYVGVYYHPERPTRWITLRGAMMFRAVRDLIPERFYESVGFGGWTNPPGPESRK